MILVFDCVAVVAYAVLVASHVCRVFFFVFLFLCVHFIFHGVFGFLGIVVHGLPRLAWPRRALCSKFLSLVTTHQLLDCFASRCLLLPC